MNFLISWLKYDCVLIGGDFNVHVCCPDKPMAKDFLNLIDSFSLMQSVSGPTHERRHTLDLVLSYGLPGLKIEICDASLTLPLLLGSQRLSISTASFLSLCTLQRSLAYGFSPPARLLLH